MTSCLRPGLLGGIYSWAAPKHHIFSFLGSEDPRILIRIGQRWLGVSLLDGIRPIHGWKHYAPLNNFTIGSSILRLCFGSAHMNKDITRCHEQSPFIFIFIFLEFARVVDCSSLWRSV